MILSIYTLGSRNPSLIKVEIGPENVNKGLNWSWIVQNRHIAFFFSKFEIFYGKFYKVYSDLKSDLKSYQFQGHDMAGLWGL